MRRPNANPCYVFHTVSASDAADGRIVLQVLRYLRRFDNDERADHMHAATLWCWTIDLAAGRLDSKSVATVHLPTRVPVGFHSNLIPDQLA